MCGRLLWAGCCVVLAGWIEATMADELARPATYTSAERQRIDENALWGPPELINKPDIEATGSVMKWLIDHVAVPVEDERKLGEEEIAEAEQTLIPTPAPDSASQVFAALIAALPERLVPDNQQAALVVTESGDGIASHAGLGRVYVNRKWLNEFPADAPTSRDQLAFVVAHELSHVCLGHTHRRYQRRWLAPIVDRELDRHATDTEVPQKLTEMKALLHAIGVMSEYVYSQEESYESDLFAIHLCRNAGFDVENCLDVLRAQSVQADRRLLDPPPLRTGTPPVEPQIQPNTTGESVTFADPPTAAQRLRRLRLELDGMVYGDFGLFEFDRVQKSFVRAADGSLPAGQRAIVCIHGMESSRDVWQELLIRFADESNGDARPPRLYAFQYPADDSLARAGEFLHRELERVGGSAGAVDFVVHSAGGLVFRWYAEVDQGEFRRVVFLGTPHHGSQLARLRGLLEAVQVVGDVSLGFDAALQQAILDGRGQITFDLAPHSLFLDYLNRDRDRLHRDRYIIHRARALSLARGLLLKGSVAASRKVLALKVKNESDRLIAVFETTVMDELEVPPEILDGDMCVTCDSAVLSGVPHVVTHSLMHTFLPRDPEVIGQVIAELQADVADPSTTAP